MYCSSLVAFVCFCAETEITDSFYSVVAEEGMKIILLVLGLLGLLLVGRSTAQTDSADALITSMCVNIEAEAIRRDRGATREETVNWLVTTANLSKANAEKVVDIAYNSADSPTEIYSKCMAPWVVSLGSDSRVLKSGAEGKPSGSACLFTENVAS
jgi:hypothetical protein